MRYRSLIHRIALLWTLVLGAVFAVSCNSIREDMPECRFYVRFKYDYNMLSTDAFHSQVQKVDLYVFDRDGKFLFKQYEQGGSLSSGDYCMEVNLLPGEYRLMAWASTGNDDSYEMPSLTRGVSTIEELELKLKRDASLRVEREIDALWYGEIITVNFTGKRHQTETINLIKDTNKIRFAFIGNNMAELNLDDYTYEIIGSNGRPGYDNACLPDDELSYWPYYKEQRNTSSVLVEMNTMRLVEGADTRFVVTKKSTGVPVLDFNLIDYLALTQTEGHGWDEQEYLDRQDEYSVVLIFSQEGVDPGTKESWLALQITVNGYTWYFQEEKGD